MPAFPSLHSRSFKPLVIAMALAAFTAVAQAPNDIRVALVIGNAAYAGNAALANPANDARAMADTLRQLGFSVVELRDGNRAQMADAIARVRDTLKGRQGVGMLYYAGHGLQLDWHNYMVPVDARLSRAADVPAQTIDIAAVIDAFKGAGNRMNILVLDACRDNPFADKATGKGLAQLDAPPGTFLAYATAPGNVAEDGDVKSGNGLYTQYLLQELKKPVAKIEDVFKRVRLNVRRASEGRQIPWESTSLEDDFFFNDGQKFTIKAEDLERLAREAREKEQELQRQAAQARERERQAALELEKERLRIAEEQKRAEAQRLAAEAQARERERQLAEATEKERLRIADEQRQLEAQRLSQAQRAEAEARARERERQLAEAAERERLRIAEEQRRAEAQRLAAEAQARERERQLALAQQQERERAAAAARALEEQRKAEAERMLALANAKAEAEARNREKLSKEEAAERLFKAQKADWDRIKGSDKAEDFYAFLDRYPGNSELGEMAQFRLDQLAKPKIQASLGQGQDASLAYTGPRFKVGDVFQYESSDPITKVKEGVEVRRVTAIRGDVVELNGGNGLVSLLGGRIKDRLGTYDPPNGPLPAEFQVGKSWTGRSVQNNVNGQIFQISSQAKVVGRETITVPAGTFQTYVIEGTNYVSNGAVRRLKAWIDPRYGLPIRSELIGRRNNGGIDRAEKMELISLQAERS